MNIPKTHRMDREEYEEEMKIYTNADPINHPDVSTETNKTRRQQTPQHTGRDCVRKRSSRSTPVCLALLCFFLLTAVVVLRLHFCTNNTNYTHERNQLLTRITNNTEERDELLTRNSEVTKERDQLRTRNSEVTKERDQLRTRNMQLMKEKEELSSNIRELIKQRDLLKMDGWIYYQSSHYFIPFEKKSWTESRRDCKEREADLMIINNREEQDFVKKISNKMWIGLTDRDAEGKWKWVDDSTMTIRFWYYQEPNGGTAENCALNDETGWADYACSLPYKWICEKNILK